MIFYGGCRREIHLCGESMTRMKQLTAKYDIYPRDICCGVSCVTILSFRKRVWTRLNLRWKDFLKSTGTSS